MIRQYESHIIAEEDCSILSRQNKDLKDGTTSKLMAELMWKASTRIPSLESNYLKRGKFLLNKDYCLATNLKRQSNKV